MRKIITRLLQCCSVYLLLSIHCFEMSAQSKRTQYPGFLTNNTFFDVTAGYINYSFTNSQIAPGYKAASITIPHVGVRLILYGYKLNKHFAVQASYARPVLWVRFNNVNGDQTNHPVVVNITGLTFKASTAFGRKISMNLEGGICHVTRTGFEINNNPVVSNASYLSLQTGAGLQYQLNDKWSLIANAGWSPANSKQLQPATIFFTGGGRYNMRRLSPEKVEANHNSRYKFPTNIIQAGITTNSFGFGVNDFFANKIIPVFWGGDVEARSGFSVNYQRNVFHGYKTFSIDMGTSFSYWKSNKRKTSFYTLSVYPQFRFTFLHSQSTDVYLNYSVAGPTYISRFRIDDTETGKHFTFRDFMGLGVFAGKKRNLNAEISIGHFSNGDLFPENNGIKIPLTFNLGYAF